MTEYDDPIVAEIQKSVLFPVDVECEAYPDVIFNVIFENSPNRATAEQIVCALENYAQAYNKKHFFKPIHYVSDIDSLPVASSTFSVCVHVDFGNAAPKALVGAVKAIADTKLAIYRVVLE